MPGTLRQASTILVNFGPREFAERMYRVMLLRTRGGAAYQRPLVNFIRDASAGFDLFVDVGAAGGEIIRHVHDAFPRSLAIEPAPHHIDALRALRLPRVDVHHCAAGATEGEVQLGVSAANPDDNVAYQRDDLTSYVTVDLRTLDGLVGDPTARALVKIDVQGYEYAVLRGATALMASGSLFVAEYWPWGMTRAGIEIDDLIGLLNEAGYRILDLRRTEISAQRLRQLYERGADNEYVVADLLLSPRTD